MIADEFKQFRSFPRRRTKVCPCARLSGRQGRKGQIAPNQRSDEAGVGLLNVALSCSALSKLVRAAA